MLSLALLGFLAVLVGLGFRRPFLWVVAYLYVDIVAPQKIAISTLGNLPISLIMFVLALVSWLLLDDKTTSRFTFRQALMVILLVYCGISTQTADFPGPAAEKWGWVWKALVFAIFLPLTLRTRLRLEAVALTMVLSAGTIVIDGAIKTLITGGGYGELKLMVNDNTGLYEGSIISCVSVAIIPLLWWLAGHGTIFPPDRRVKLFAAGLTIACLLIPVGTQARTGLLCIGLLGVLSLRSVKRPLLYILGAAAALAIAMPFLPKTYTQRMGTIENHQSDESASTRMAVWAWTLGYVADHPFGGGFESYRQNRLTIKTRSVSDDGGGTSSVSTDTTTDAGRAFHSSYFEMLGEQGWPGLGIWLLLQFTGLAQMEVLRLRWKKRKGPGEQWQAPLASALQQAQLVYMCGSFFVGIAFQPFILMLIGLQCGVWSYLQRLEAVKKRGPRPVARMA